MVKRVQQQFYGLGHKNVQSLEKVECCQMWFVNVVDMIPCVWKVGKVISVRKTKDT